MITAYSRPGIMGIDTPGKDVMIAATPKKYITPNDLWMINGQYLTKIRPETRNNSEAIRKWILFDTGLGNFSLMVSSLNKNDNKKH